MQLSETKLLQVQQTLRDYQPRSPQSRFIFRCLLKFWAFDTTDLTG